MAEFVILAACDWPAATGCCAMPAPGEDDGADLARAASAEILWALSGRQFGLCESLVRPCRESCFDWSLPPAPGDWRAGVFWTPVLSQGQWTNISCGRCGDPCSCKEVSQVALPGPAWEIEEVLVDGEPLDADAYRVDRYTQLVRQDGGRWPACQDVGAPADSAGTWSVKYKRGVPLTPGGVRANGIYACELWKSCSGDKSCRLPQNVQTITQHGLTIGLNPLDFVNEGLTGVSEVDQWLRAVNPLHRPSGARVVSPDAPDGVVTTWP